MINQDNTDKKGSGSALRFGLVQKLLLAFTPLIVAVSGIIAFFLAGWNSAQITPLRQWAAEREGKEIYSRLIHEGPLSPGDLLQNPTELDAIISADSEVYAAALFQGNSLVASHSKISGFTFPVEKFPADTGATVLDDNMGAYRRFFGPGGGDSGRHQGGGRGSGSGSGRGPRWMRAENDSGGQENLDSRQDRLNIVLVFQTSDADLIRPLVYQKWLWPLVWLVLSLLWGIIIVMQKRLVRYQLQMQKESNLAAIGEMSARLAHEIRNPLGAIRGIAQLLHRKMAESDEKNMVKTIEQETFRLDSLTGSILDFSRTPQCTVVLSKVEKPVQDAVELFRSKNSSLIVHCDFPDKEVAAMFDDNALRQIMLNLLSNAADAAESVNGQVKVEILEGHAKVFVRVINAGGPISDDQLDKIFEPFVSSKARGYGLGLPISRRLAETMGGRLTLANGSDETVVAELELKKAEAI